MSALPPLDQEAPRDVRTATFGLGCFWGPDARFGVVPGVVRTRVGYTGGRKADPTYHSLGDHTESVQIDYDPSRCAYADLLRIFWENHDPTRETRKRQYMPAVFVHGDEQREAAEASRLEAGRRVEGDVKTPILPLHRFYRAETYHQKYRLQRASRLFEEFEAIYPQSGWVDSTAAARVNGFLAGYGRLETLKAEVDSYGLSSEGQSVLLQQARRPAIG